MIILINVSARRTGDEIDGRPSVYDGPDHVLSVVDASIEVPVTLLRSPQSVSCGVERLTPPAG
jgi:hypothetical protein